MPLNPWVILAWARGLLFCRWVRFVLSLTRMDAQCAEQLTRQRWPEGFRCPRCAGGARGYFASRRVHECKQCGYHCSVTAGTIFHKTRPPLSSWLWTIFRRSHDKKGISAGQLMKEIGVSHVTAWTMRYKIRKAMEDRGGRYKLYDINEVDDGYGAGPKPVRAAVDGMPRPNAWSPWRSNTPPRASPTSPLFPDSPPSRCFPIPRPRASTAFSGPT